MKTMMFGSSAAALALLLSACGADDDGYANNQTYDSPTESAAEDATRAESARAADGYGDRDNADDEMTPEGFVFKAAQSNLLEIESSRLAVDRASRPEVRALAETMVSDHTNAGEKLRAAANELALTPPAALDSDHQAKIRDLNDAGDDFDADYLDLQEEAHEKAIGLFERYAGSDDAAPELRSFARSALPALRSHLTRVREVREGFDLGDDMLGVDSGDDDMEDFGASDSEMSYEDDTDTDVN